MKGVTVPARRAPATGTEPEIVPFEDVPQPRRKTVRTPNPMFESVKKLYESMAFGHDGTPTDRSTDAMRKSVPDAEVRRHLRWLWDAGDAQEHPVTVKQTREPDPQREGYTIIWYWTAPKIRKGHASGQD